MAEIQFGPRWPPGELAGHRLVTIPAARYTSPAFLAFEWEHLWPNVWLMAGFASDAQNPGDWFVFELGRLSILVLRDEDGVAAFHNTSQLPTVPDSARHLRRVTTQVWAGLVWVCIGEPSETLEEYLGPIHEHVGRYRLDEYSIDKDRTLLWETNWKLALDGFNETYHVSSVHPQFAPFAYPEAAPWQFSARHSLFILRIGERRPGQPAEIEEPLAAMVRAAGEDPARYAGRLDDARRLAMRHVRAKATASGCDLSALIDEQLLDHFDFYVFPNLIIDVHGADDVGIYRYRPDAEDPGRCLVDVITLSRSTNKDRKRPPSAGIVLPEASGLPPVYQQDRDRTKGVQRGLRTRRTIGPLASSMEQRIPHLHEVLDTYVAAHIPPEMRVRITTPVEKMDWPPRPG